MCKLLYLSHWIVSIGDWKNVWLKFLCDFRESILFHNFFSPYLVQFTSKQKRCNMLSREIWFNENTLSTKVALARRRVSNCLQAPRFSWFSHFLFWIFEDILFILSLEFRRKKASELVKFARVFRNNTFFLLLNFSRFNWIILILHYRVVEIVNEIQNLSSKYSASEKIVARALNLYCTYLICVIEPMAMDIFYIFWSIWKII